MIIKYSLLHVERVSCSLSLIKQEAERTSLEPQTLLAIVQLSFSNQKVKYALSTIIPGHTKCLMKQINRLHFWALKISQL